MNRVEDIDRDRTGDRLGEEMYVTERGSEARTDRDNERSPATLVMEPSYRNVQHSPIVSRTQSPRSTTLSPNPSSPPPPPPLHTMDTSNVRFRPVPVLAQAGMTSTHGHPWLTWPARAKFNSDIRISNQFLMTRALHFAQPRCTTTLTVGYYQVSVAIPLGRRV